MAPQFDLLLVWFHLLRDQAFPCQVTAEFPYSKSVPGTHEGEVEPGDAPALDLEIRQGTALWGCHPSCLSKDILWRPHFVSVLP